MNLFYILKDKVPVQAEDIDTWGQWMETNKFTEGRVGDDTIDGIRVSTIFTGINTGLSKPPRLFETAIFRPEDIMITKSCTWEEAELTHKMAIEKLKETNANSK